MAVGMGSERHSVRIFVVDIEGRQSEVAPTKEGTVIVVVCRGQDDNSFEDEVVKGGTRVASRRQGVIVFPERRKRVGVAGKAWIQKKYI